MCKLKCMSRNASTAASTKDRGPDRPVSVRRRRKSAGSILTDLAALKRRIRSGIRLRGLDEFCLSGRTLRADNGWDGRTATFGCASITLDVAAGLGIVQPLTALLSGAQGRVSDVDGLAAAFINEIACIQGRRAGLVAARDALALMTGDLCREMAGEGVLMELLSIELVEYDPRYPRKDWSGEQYNLFDVHMMLLGDDKGSVERGHYIMSACEPEEFVYYLRRSIIPEQRTFARALVRLALDGTGSRN